jgi:hypothetical protein
MFRHFFKIASRNLWKYKSQTLISVIGLAVGFACFAMATLWVRYEMTYDSFLKNADRIYCISKPSPFSLTGVSRKTTYRLAGYLKSTFPEIAHAVTVIPSYYAGMTVDEGVKISADVIQIDSSFFEIFDVKVLEGNMDFLIPETKSIAITRTKARQLFGNESPVGKKFRLFNGDEESTVCAVVTDLPKRSNYPFDILFPMKKEMRWGYSYGEHTLIELHSGVDVDAFHKKLYEHTIPDYSSITKMTLIPLVSVRYEDPEILRDVKFQHIVIFSVSGLLLILCTLFNYLTLFISRFRIRQRELALRIVCGASNRSLFTMLSVEFLMSLIIALVLGFLCILAIISPFRELSGSRVELSSIYFESSIYIAGIIVISLLAFIATLAVFRRRTLSTSIHRTNRKLLRKTSVVVQLVISIVFAFCTIVILKQMYHLHNTDLGFAVKDRASIHITHSFDIDMLDNKIKQIPEITGTVTGYMPLIPISYRSSYSVTEWDDKPENAERINIENFKMSKEFIEYYEIKTVEGEFTYDGHGQNFINESAAKAFGWHTAVGKMFDGKRADGVIRNIYHLSPTANAIPCAYIVRGKESNENNDPAILFKFNEGTWKTCKQKIEEIIHKEYPNLVIDKDFYITNTEEKYGEFLKSENTLLRILTVVSLVCVIVCIFGFVSMVSLTCEERRKEIAVRKIHGATVKDILDIFLKEYLTLLLVGAVIAFIVGYLIMKRWLANYVVQTEISAWIYAVILLALIMTIVLCVGGKVYRTSRANPADSIKS